MTTTTTGADITIPIGVYRGPAVDIGPIQAYEQFLGMPAGQTVANVLAFMADTPANWTQFEQATLATTTNGPPGPHTATAWEPLLAGRQLMLAVPACCCGTTWNDEAGGANDAHWAALARTLTSGGLGDCSLRIGREFNGGWYRWTAGPSNSSAYKAGYARIVATMRDAGFTGTFVWNPYLGRGTFGATNTGVESIYPGDTVIDAIGLDLYDGPDAANYPVGQTSRTPAQQQAVWQRFLTEWDGLTGWRSLAASHGQPLAFPEWGLRLWNDAGKYEGGGDNPVLISQMAAWLLDTGAWMHGLWEDPGYGVADPDDSPARHIPVPQARTAFLQAFGYQPPG